MTNRWQVWVIILWIQQGRVLKLWHRFPQASATREGGESGEHTHTHPKTKVTHEPRHKWVTCGSERQICNHSLSGTNRHGAFNSRLTGEQQRSCLLPHTRQVYDTGNCTLLKPCPITWWATCHTGIYAGYITGFTSRVQTWGPGAWIGQVKTPIWTTGQF